MKHLARARSLWGFVSGVLWGLGGGVGLMLWLLVKLLRYQRSELERRHAWARLKNKQQRGAAQGRAQPPPAARWEDLDPDFRELLRGVDEALTGHGLPRMGEDDLAAAVAVIWGERDEGGPGWAINKAVEEILNGGVHATLTSGGAAGLRRRALLRPLPASTGRGAWHSVPALVPQRLTTSAVRRRLPPASAPWLVREVRTRAPPPVWRVRGGGRGGNRCMRPNRGWCARRPLPLAFPFVSDFGMFAAPLAPLKQLYCIGVSSISLGLNPSLCRPPCPLVLTSIRR
ncbi:MAG: hypothetical protein J3K34DRAFT_258392 [Monoraphidium minutum]|nr:MAG: hypothetical protein J3K34DRAFT_258392 [Monoraphidium minutum]